MYIDNSCKNCCFKPTMYNLNRLKTRMTSGNVCMLLSMNVVSWRVAKYKNPGKRNFNTSPWQIYDLRSQKGYRAIANTFFVPMLISWGKGPRSQMLLIINPFSKVELSWLGLKLHCWHRILVMMSDYLHYWSPRGGKVASNVSEGWCLTLLTCSSWARFTNIGTRSDLRYSTWAILLQIESHPKDWHKI